MPGWGIVAADAEIRAANDFQVVGQAGMPNGEIVRGEIDFLIGDQAIQVRFVWIIQDLLVSVVLHHDYEHVIQTLNAFRDIALLSAYSCGYCCCK
jgi:hypothetical protein